MKRVEANFPQIQGILTNLTEHNNLGPPATSENKIIGQLEI